MIAVVDTRFRLLDNLTKSFNDSSKFISSYHKDDKILHEYEGKEYYYKVVEVVHKTGKSQSTIIVVESLNGL